MRDSNSADYDTAKINERYFRPSPLPALNIINFDYDFFDKYYNPDYTKIVLPNYLFYSPEETILNYFSILREAEDISTGGCGSIGEAKSPYPISFNFLTTEYQNNIGYEAYLNSFNEIGHINLVKLNNITTELTPKGIIRYFFELETIEPSLNGNTSFAYYYGFIDIKNQNGNYKISNIDVRGEDFLCAAYHGWVHNAELYVDITFGDWCHLIKKRYPTEQSCYIKIIYVDGTDGHKYKFLFFQLTNGTDVLINVFILENNAWKPIDFDPDKCFKQ